MSDIPSITIEKWQGGKKAALAVNFDDWTPGQIYIGTEVMREFGFVGTYNVTVGNMHMAPNFDHWGKLQELVWCGSEVANHTLHHRDLLTLKDSERRYEIYEAKRIIDSRITGAVVDTISYPCGRYDDEVIVDAMIGHVGARVFSGNTVRNFDYNFARCKEDYYQVRDFEVSPGVTEGEVKEVLEGTIEKNGFLPCVFHGIYNDEHKNDIDLFDAVHEMHLRRTLELVKRYRNQLWVTTLSKALKYHKARSLINIEFCGEKEGALNYEVTSTGRIFCEQLGKVTAKLNLRLDQNCVSIKQDDEELAFDLVEGAIHFQMQPERSNISIVIQ